MPGKPKGARPCRFGGDSHVDKWRVFGALLAVGHGECQHCRDRPKGGRRVPTYQYTCTECSQPLEVVQSFSDDALTECPACGGRLRKVFSAVGIVFKGSGFYRNDSRASTNGKSSSEKSSETKGDSAKKSENTSGNTASADGSSSSSSTNGSDKSSSMSKPATTAASSPSS